ncbi:MAG: hypothetical protein J1F38_00915 [Muribaculaceae bacterium]|nr:hypothetical protein [Muribaculaceae bacterium]
MHNGLKKILLLSFIGTLLCAPAILTAQVQHKEWQEAKNITANFKAVSSLPDIEVFSAPNIIMLKVNKQTEVRIFTILGKLISSQLLEPGVFEYQLDAHGIYLIKTEHSSCKIAV